MQHPEALSVDQKVQEQVRGSWQHMVAVMCLNLTSGKQVRPVLPIFFSRWSTPEALLAADQTEVEDVLRPLGLYKRRAASLFKMSREFLSWDGVDPRDLHGIGQYGADSYEIFIRGRRDVVPKDKELRKFLGLPPISRVTKSGNVLL